MLIDKLSDAFEYKPAPVVPAKNSDGVVVKMGQQLAQTNWADVVNHIEGDKGFNGFHTPSSESSRKSRAMGTWRPGGETIYYRLNQALRMARQAASNAFRRAADLASI